MGGFRRSLLAIGLVISGIIPVNSVIAAETITYIYDARGRVVRVVRTGTVNNGVTTVHTLDKADNRKNITTTGSPNPPPP